MFKALFGTNPKFKFALAIALLGTLSSAVHTGPISCAGFETARFCDITGTYTQGGKEQEVSVRIGNQDLFDANRLQVREYYYIQEFFEGSLALTQMAVAWKQVSTQAGDQINTGFGNTQEVVKIAHFWQLPHLYTSGDTLDYNDVRVGSNDPLINDYMEVLYTNPMKGPTYSDLPNQDFYQWFIGDLVPMQSCAYIVNMNTKDAGATKSYSFQRMVMSIEYDLTLNKKKVLLSADAATIFSPSAPGHDDMMLTHVPINYYGKWSAFYWFKNGEVIIKQDSTFTADTDPCARDTPVFAAGSTLVHWNQAVCGAAETIISHAFVFESLYTVCSGSTRQIGRLEGVPGNWCNQEANFFNLDLVASNANMLPGDEINQIVSYEFYGLFVNLKGKPYFVEIEPDKIIGRNADGTLAMTDPAAKCYSYVDTLRYDVCCPNDTTLTLGLRVREDAKNIHCPAATEFKFAQTQGEMSMHRPVWMICEGKETTAYRVTTVINEAWSIPATHPTVDYTKLWSFELQTLRFHMFNVQPGVTDTTSPVNAGCTTTAPCSPTAPCMGCKDLSQLQTFQATEAVVVGLRKEDEVLRWPLATCGDTLVNSTYGFEDCDYAKNFDTPINLVDLQPPNNDWNTYNYPAPTTADTYGNGGTVLAVDNQRFVVPWPNHPDGPPAVGNVNNALERWSGPVTIWFDVATKSYYNCNLLCKKVKIDLCGDGIPSNGRVPNAAPTPGYKKDPTNQESGTDLVAGDPGYEACDDGNNMSGDGCSADCSTVEDGFECPRWGVACNSRCGNGHREWYEDPLNPGNILSTSYRRLG